MFIRLFALGSVSRAMHVGLLLPRLKIRNAMLIATDCQKVGIVLQ